MKKNRIYYMLAVLVLFIYGMRVFYINNESFDVAEKKYMKKYEFAKIGENLFWDSNEQMNGYEVRVNDVRIRNESDAQVLLLDITVRNTNKNESDALGMNFTNLKVSGDNILLPVDEENYVKENPELEGNMLISLRPESEMDFVLPYLWDEKEEMNEEWIKKHRLVLVLSYYPEKRMIKLWEE